MALLDNAAANRALASYEVDVGGLRKELSDFLDRQPPSPVPTEREPDASPNAAFQRVLQKAAAWANQFGADELSGSEIMFSILHEGGSFAPRLLAKQGFGRGIQFGRPSR